MGLLGSKTTYQKLYADNVQDLLESALPSEERPAHFSLLSLTDNLSSFLSVPEEEQICYTLADTFPGK